MLPLVYVFLMTAPSLQYVHTAATRREIDEMISVVFPVPAKSEKIQMVDNIPDECRDKTYCTIKPPDYPEEQFNNMFKDKKVIPQPSIYAQPMLFNRQGDPDEKDDCQSEESFEPLYKVRSKRDNTWQTVVQAPDHDYVQRVRLETCQNPGGSCFDTISTLGDIITFCKQKYIEFQLVVANGTNGTKLISVDLPVCCSCAYKSAPIETRFGVPSKITPIERQLFKGH